MLGITIKYGGKSPSPINSPLSCLQILQNKEQGKTNHNGEKEEVWAKMIWYGGEKKNKERKKESREIGLSFHSGNSQKGL